MRAFSTRAPACNARAHGRAPTLVCNAKAEIAGLDRRALLLSVSGALLSQTGQARAVPPPPEVVVDGFVTYFGAASPPTSYGGYGGNVNEAPKYSFERPADWKMQVVNKVQKV